MMKRLHLIAAFPAFSILLIGLMAALSPTSGGTLVRVEGNNPLLDEGLNIVFAPHRAIYDISLARSQTGSSVATLDGRLVYELTGTHCDGYTQNLRFVTRTANRDGGVRLTDLRTSSWEAAASSELKFDSQNYQDEVLTEETRGTARRTTANSATAIQLRKPVAKIVTIDKAALFPIAHSKAVIAAARKGETLFHALFYDGSENGEKVYSTTAAIGKRTPTGTVRAPPRLDNGPAPDSIPSWPVAMSYFERKTNVRDAIPAFEMSYRFHENGVTSKFLIDHGEIAFKGKLVALAYLKSSSCDPNASENKKQAPVPVAPAATP